MCEMCESVGAIHGIAQGLFEALKLREAQEILESPELDPNDVMLPHDHDGPLYNALSMLMINAQIVDAPTTQPYVFRNPQEPHLITIDINRLYRLVDKRMRARAREIVAQSKAGQN